MEPITLSLAVWYAAMFLLKPDVKNTAKEESDNLRKIGLNLKPGVVNTAENTPKEESDNLREICRKLLSLIEQKEQSQATLIKQLQHLPEGNCHSYGVLQVQNTVSNYPEVADYFKELKELIKSQKPITSHYDQVAKKIGVYIVGDNAEINIENLIAGTQGCSLLELSQLLERMNITNESLLSKIDKINTLFVKNSDEEVSDIFTPEQIDKDEVKSNFGSSLNSMLIELYGYEANFGSSLNSMLSGLNVDRINEIIEEHNHRQQQPIKPNDIQEFTYEPDYLYIDDDIEKTGERITTK